MCTYCASVRMGSGQGEERPSVAVPKISLFHSRLGLELNACLVTGCAGVRMDALQGEEQPSVAVPKIVLRFVPDQALS